MSEPTAHSEGDRIIAKVNGSVVEGDWQTMKTLAKDILDEAETHKTDLQKADEIFAADIRISCHCCDYEEDFDSAREVRDRGATPEEHADHPDFECEPDDVTVEAVCSRHGTIPLAYDRCDSCADAEAVMKR